MDQHGPHHHRHSHHHHNHQQQPFQTMMIQNPSYPTTTNLPLPPFQPHFPFNPTYPNPTTATPGYTHDGSRSGSGSGSGEFSIDPSSKKKRGRPRKYSHTDNSGNGGGGGGISLGLSPTSGHGGSHQVDGEGGSGVGAEQRKNRGRPSGSGKKQLDALGNCGVGFTPHVILVNAGEDIASKIIAFAKDGPRTVCVMSANGSICNASLRQPGNIGGIVNYEGRYEIISLLGSFLFSEDSGNVRTNGLSVSMAGSDGRVLGGGVAGMLLAASTVQIIVGSFIADGKKIKSMPTVPNSHMLSFSSPPPDAGSSPSQGASSEGSEEHASNHIDRDMGPYSNSNHPMHHHNMQMYTHMGWSSSGLKMLNHQM